MSQERETIIFCMDTSGSMCSHFADEVSRLAASVALMDKFADALIGCDSRSLCGFIQFSSQVTLSAALGPASDFKAALKGDINAFGATSLFHALDLAVNQLLEQKINNMRIICITDGCATDMDLADRVTERIMKERIRLDAVFLAPEIEYRLMALARKTGGIFVRPKTMADIDQLVQQEAFFKVSRRQYDLFNPAPLEEVVREIREDPGLQVAWTRVPERLV